MSAGPLASALESLPPSWTSVPLKHLAEINLRCLPETTAPDTDIFYVDISTVDSLGSIAEPARLAFGEAPSRARRVVRPGDILVSTVRTYLRAIACVPGAGDGWVASTGFAVVTPRTSVDGRYLYWCVRSDPFVEEVVAQSVGVSYPAINASDVARLRIPLPRPQVQKRLADYLDRECARIDDLIAEQQRFVGLLGERRRAELTNLLLGDAARGVKVVNVPWSVEVPAHWDVMSLRHCVDMITVGIVVNPSSYYEPEGVPCLRGLNITPGRVSARDLVFMSDDSNRLHAKSMLRSGDLVVVRTGNAGAAAVVPNWAVGGNAIDLLLIRPGERFEPRFLELLLNSHLAREQVKHKSVGALQAHFNVGALAKLKVPCPPMREQRELLRRADNTLQRLEETINEVSHSIDLLREHKQALITSVVTGQKEVA